MKGSFSMSVGYEVIALYILAVGKKGARIKIQRVLDIKFVQESPFTIGVIEICILHKFNPPGLNYVIFFK